MLKSLVSVLKERRIADVWGLPVFYLSTFTDTLPYPFFSVESPALSLSPRVDESNDDVEEPPLVLTM